jgi:uncharacterized protein YggE
VPDPAEDRITVSGFGVATGTPDLLILVVGAEAVDESPAAAFDTATRSLTAMVAALKAAGVEEQNLQTGSASVSTHWEDRNQPTRVYRASQQVTARLHDMDTAGDLTGAVINAGGSAARLQQLSLSFSDTTELHRLAREAAWRDAVAKATQYAELAGRPLGPVRHISVNTGGGVIRRQYERASAGVDSLSSMPVEPGQSDINAIVEVEWALLG